MYQFTCNESDCTSTYIGYTTNKLSERASQHKYNPSKIHLHYKTEHNINKINNISDNFKVLYTNNNLYSLKIAEAIYIKKFRPDINIKFNEMNLKLNII